MASQALAEPGSTSGSRRAEIARRGRRQVALFWGASVLALLMLAPFGTTVTGLLGAWIGGCPLKEVTGVPCPTCGTTRSALLLSRFDVLEALVRYPLPTLAWITYIGGGLLSSAWVLTGRDLPSLPGRLPRWVLVTGAAALLANWAWSIHTGV